MYTTTRAVLRELLGRYLNESPASLRFEVNPYGKPTLTDAYNRRTVQFNVSHSGEYALLAFSCEFPVGVDVERIRPLTHEIADLLLSPNERERFLQLPAQQRRDSLFHAWTSKEAIIKALGKGISIPLENVEVAINPENPPSLVHLSPKFGQPHDWKLHGLKIDEDYSAAVAAHAAISQLECWNWVTDG